MNIAKHYLVITDNENSSLVRLLLKRKIIPITRKSIISAIDLLQHIEVSAIVIDTEQNHIDSLEFVLNARDISSRTPIMIPGKYISTKEWKPVKDLGNIISYDDTNQITALETQL